MEKAFGHRFRLCLFALWVTFISVTLYPFEVNANNIAHVTIENFLNDSLESQISDSHVNPHIMDAIWGVTTSVFVAGFIVGSLSCKLFADRMSPKQCLILVPHPIIICGVLCIAISKYTNLFELLILGRLLCGFAQGLSGSMTLPYLIEISPANCRGFVCSLRLAFVNALYIISSTVALPNALGSAKYWSILFAIPGFVSVLALLSYAILPESPFYVHQKQNNKEKASKILQQFHGITECESDELLKNAVIHDPRKKITWRMVCSSRSLRRGIILGYVAASCCYTFSGAYAFTFYSASLIQTAGFDAHSSQRAAIGIQAVLSVVAVCSVAFVSKFNRRTVLWLMPVNIVGLACAAAILVVRKYVALDKQSIMSIIALVFLVIGTVSFRFGSDSVLCILPAELVPAAARSLATSSSNVLFAVLSLGIIALFPVFEGIVDAWTILMLFSVPAMVCYTYLMIYLPETNKRSIEEITTELLVKKRCCSDASEKISKWIVKRKLLENGYMQLD